MYDFMNQMDPTSTKAIRNCMVNPVVATMDAGESPHIEEVAKVFGTYAGRAKIAIEEAQKTKYTDAKQTMLMEQVALGLAWIADEIAELRRGDKDGKP